MDRIDLSDSEAAVAQLFLDLLDDDGAVDFLSKAGYCTLSEQQQANMERLAVAFVEDSILQGEERPHKRPKGDNEKGGKKTTKGGPWARFTKLKELALPSELARVARMSQEHGPAVFLSDRQYDSQDLISKILGNESTARSAQSFADRYSFTTRLLARQTRDPFLFCLQMLMYFEIGQIIGGGGQGQPEVSYVGSAMQRKFRSFLSSLEGINEATAEKWCRKWCHWFAMGRKVNKLCTLLGYGCLFYISSHLSQDFLTTKFTSSGPKFDTAIQHLRHLQRLANFDHVQLDEIVLSLRTRLVGVYHAVPIMAEPNPASPRSVGEAGGGPYTAPAQDVGATSIGTPIQNRQIQQELGSLPDPPHLEREPRAPVERTGEQSTRER